MPQPNILYIHSHDTGRYVQPYGHAVPTPNLQRLAEQGVLCRQCFNGGPTCSPSRAALLTGQSPHSCGMIGLAHRGFRLNDYSHHIVHTLKAAGYHTALSGMQHVAPKPEMIGYDELVDARSAGGVSQAAVQFLRAAPEQPFFLAVGYGHTHREFPAPGPSEDERYCRAPDPLPDTPRTRRDMACFKASARMLDTEMGCVFDALDETGLAGNTLVICTTDHGIAFPYMKCNLTDHGIGVMLIMRGPGGFEGGKVIDGLVSQVDLFPTVCDLLGIDAPARLEGRSIVPLVRGEAQEVNDEVFSEVTYHASYEPMRCVRTRRWKYIRRFDDRDRPVMPNCDDSPSKSEWLDHGWRERPAAQEQLYDLVFDPNEACNVAGDRSLAGVLDEMRGRLKSWMERTHDALLRGPFPAPSDARVNAVDGLSPQEPTQAAR